MEPETRQERQRKLLVMTDDKLCDEMRKYHPAFQKESGFIARTIREIILNIEFPAIVSPSGDPAKTIGINSP